MAFQSGVHGVVAALTLAMVMVLNLVDRVHGGGFSGGGWNQAHATYYGGADASGTQGMCRSICSLSSFHFIYLVQLECRSEPAPSTSRHMKKNSISVVLEWVNLLHACWIIWGAWWFASPPHGLSSIKILVVECMVASQLAKKMPFNTLSLTNPYICSTRVLMSTGLHFNVQPLCMCL